MSGSLDPSFDPSLPNPAQGDGEPRKAPLDPALLAEIMQSEAVPNDDGSVSLMEPEEDPLDQDPRTVQPHNANLAMYIKPSDLSAIATEVLEAIEADFTSNEAYYQRLLDGIESLGLKKERLSLPFDGACGARHPMTLMAAVRFNANAMSELMPPQGPVRMQVFGDTPDLQTRSTRKQKFLNYHLTVADEEYYSDVDQGLMALGILGTIYRKVWRDPVTGLPASRFRTPFSLLVAYNATSMRGDYTEIDPYTHAEVRRLQVTGHWRDVELGTPTESDTPGSRVRRQVEDREPSQRVEDNQHCIYTRYCLMDMPPLQHMDAEGKPTGLPLPFMITVDRDSQQVLRIERNWKADDSALLPKDWYSPYRYLPGLGWPGIGLAELLASPQDAGTAMLRQAVDSFTLSSFPGGLRAKGARMEDNSVTVGPCEFKEIDTGGLPIQQAVMALPYRDIPPSFAPLFQAITEGGQQLGSIAEMNVGEGNQNAPVGSTLALIEQAVRVESMVIRRLHIALRKEVRMLAELFAEEPDRKYPFTVNGQQGVAIGGDFSDTTDIVPVSDPNAPTQLQRMTMAQTKFQLAQQSGGIMDMRVAIENVLRTMGCDDQEIARAMPPPQQGAPADPVTEFGMVLKGMPLAVGPQQAHQAHLMAHFGQMQLPNMPPNVYQAMLAHCGDHLAALYAMEISNAVGTPIMPGQPMNPQMEQMISMRVAQATDQAIQNILPIMQSLTPGGEKANDPSKMARVQLDKEKLDFQKQDADRKDMAAARKDMQESIREKAQMQERQADRNADLEKAHLELAETLAQASAARAGSNRPGSPR